MTKGVNTYWLSKPLQTVFNHKHSVYVDGGGENVRFGIELLYANQDGVMKGSLRDRVSAGFSLQYTYKTFMLKTNYPTSGFGRRNHLMAIFLIMQSSCLTTSIRMRTGNMSKR